MAGIEDERKQLQEERAQSQRMMEELLQLSDRIAVIYGGELMGILPRGTDPLTIGSLMMGKRLEGAEA